MRATTSTLRATRLTVPQPPVRQVHRERLHHLLDAATRRPVVAVTGGPGSGKTFAVAQWARRPGSPPVAWVSLEPADRDPAHLAAVVVESVRDALGGPRLDGLRSSRSADGSFLHRIETALGGRRLVVVLDDVHVLDDSPALEPLERYVRHPGSALTLVLVARHEPHVSLHRRRLSGELGQVDDEDLRLTADEAATVLRAQGIALSPAGVDHLMAATEGWPAGMRLAVLTLEGAPDPERSAAAFGGASPLVDDYLTEEVLRGLGPARAALLGTTCVVDRICAPLAQALTGQECGALLDEVARANALVVELEGTGWYRYHPLLTQMLRSRLERDHPARAAELHRRAALWLEAHGEEVLALEHAVASGDQDLMRQVALRSAAARLLSTESAHLAGVLSRVPPRPAGSDPELEVIRGLAAACSGDPATAAALAGRAEPALAALPTVRATTARLVVALVRYLQARTAGDPVAMTHHAGAAVTLLDGLDPGDAPAWDTVRGVPLALAGIGELWQGRHPSAVEHLTTSLRTTASTSLDGYAGVHLVGHLALALVGSGQVTAAREVAHEALTRAHAMGWADAYETGPAWLALASVELEQGDLRACADAVGHGTRATLRGYDPFVRAHLRMLSARRDALAGDLPAARRLLHETEDLLRSCPAGGDAPLVRVVTHAFVESVAGRPEFALAALEGTEPSPDGAGVLGLARARALLGAGRHAHARAEVEPLLTGSGPRTATAWVLTCLVEDHERHDAAALDALGRALALSAPDGLLLPFLSPSVRLRAVLERHLALVGTHADLVRRALATAPTRVVEPGEGLPADLGPVVLTERERSVLAYLPAMSSNEEIAAGLAISVNTVKHHLKAIYRKLGVRTRRDAVRAVGRVVGGVVGGAVDPAG